MSTLKDFLNESGMLDLSRATFFDNTNENGCITLIPTSSGTRLRLNAALYTDLDKPATVDVIFLGKNLVISQAHKSKPHKVGKGGIIYNSPLAKKVAEHIGVIPKDKSITVGSYEMTKIDNNHKAAFISFESDVNDPEQEVTGDED